jgi:hypothetical protein
MEKVKKMLVCDLVSKFESPPTNYSSVLPLDLDTHLELGKQQKVTVFYIFYVKRRFAFLILKIYTETTLENFACKTCYNYIQAYDVILICLILVKILYSNYMLYYKENV